MIKLIVTLVIHGDGSNRYKHAKIFNQNYVLIQVLHIKKMIIERFHSRGQHLC